LLTLPEIETRVRELARQVSAPERLLPTFGHSEDGARPHVEVDRDGRLHYVVVERGSELERRTTLELDDLLWQIFQYVTFSMASEFEVKHRIPHEDCRRLIFAKQIELLGMLAPEWANRERANHKTILEHHPFDDASTARARLTAALRKAGGSPETAWRRACERYPLPVAVAKRSEDA
jgi:hypothetical protein